MSGPSAPSLLNANSAAPVLPAHYDILMAQGRECLRASPPLVVQGQKALIYSSPQAQIQNPHTALTVQEIPHPLTHAPQEVWSAPTDRP